MNKFNCTIVMLNYPTISHLRYSCCCRQSAFYSTKTNFRQRGEKLNKCYDLLGLKNECTKEELKSRYLQLAKKYHPDSANSESDAEKFRGVCEAYNFIIDNDCSVKEKENLQDIPKVYDIRHTAPQHRQYLEYGGVGYGTPSQRQKQYQQYRVQQAIENVNDYMVQKIMAEDDYTLITQTKSEAEYARKWKTRGAIDRLVEDLIQESMKKGEFKNLAGQGKPLKYESHNPYVDSTTQKLNQILIQNGYTPEWVLLEKEIKQDKTIIKNTLKAKIQKLGNSSNWSYGQKKEWDDFLVDLNESCLSLNKRIDHFNLVCPALSKQMVRFQLNKEAEKTLSNVNHESKSEFNSYPDRVEPLQDAKPVGVFQSVLSAFNIK